VLYKPYNLNVVKKRDVHIKRHLFFNLCFIHQ
jgi:hypothetical protein